MVILAPASFSKIYQLVQELETVQSYLTTGYIKHWSNCWEVNNLENSTNRDEWVAQKLQDDRTDAGVEQGVAVR
jgi:hypothetical protein